MIGYKQRIKEFITAEHIGSNVEIYGWVRTFRNNQFLSVNDGSSIQNLQVVVNEGVVSEELMKKLSTGAAVRASGKLLESQGKGQITELVAEELEVLGEANPEKFPIQMKRHSMEFLREKAHLRFRTNTFAAVFRIRHAMSFAIHKYFNDNGFFYLHSPIITGSDAEGAGEMFRVTNFDLDNIPRDESGAIDSSKDFFGKETNLTVSGQLEAELGAMALGNVYTFGPTFRAENSNTSRHLAEFWMVEPEMAFCDLDDNMNLAEDFIKKVLKYVIIDCKEDLIFLNERLINEDKTKPLKDRNELNLIERLNFVVNNDFVRINYTEAFDILRNSKPNKKKKFKYPINEWGVDLQSEHERFLVEKHFKKPVIIYDYPAKIKAFYMRMNEDGKTVRAMDILFPGIGEIVGGSQREERLDVLKERISELNIDEKELWWYLDLRKYGSVKHSGFGLGLERLILFATGMSNIRDVVPFPRTPKNAEF